jgi:hypothetical protein
MLPDVRQLFLLCLRKILRHQTFLCQQTLTLAYSPASGQQLTFHQSSSSSELVQTPAGAATADGAVGTAAQAPQPAQSNAIPAAAIPATYLAACSGVPSPCHPSTPSMAGVAIPFGTADGCPVPVAPWTSTGTARKQSGPAAQASSAIWVFSQCSQHQRAQHESERHNATGESRHVNRLYHYCREA